MSEAESEIVTSREEGMLREEIERAELELGRREEILYGVEAELENLQKRTREFDVLSSILASIDELESLDAGHLFFGEDIDPGEARQRLQAARDRADNYSEEIAATEVRRDESLRSIEEQNETLDKLHYDLRDAIEEAESRRNEWIPEREEGEAPEGARIMPWFRGTREDVRFRYSLAASLLVAILIGFLTSIVVLPIPERAEIVELPERMAKLVREERERPPPPEPEEAAPEPEEPEPEPEPQEQLAEEIPEETVPETVEEPVVADTRAPQPDSREQVKSKGILAFRDSFADRANDRPSAQLGSQARIRDAGEQETGRPERAMVTTTAPGSSGGINLASISRDVGGGGGGQAIAGVQTTRVASSIGGAEGPERPLAAGVAAGRTDEEIQIVFDRYKAALYRLYNRELRKDPTLRGQIVLELTIEPDGSVSFCEVRSSSMDAPMLAQQVVSRVNTFDFGAKQDVAPITIIYPIDFLPAA